MPDWFDRLQGRRQLSTVPLSRYKEEKAIVKDLIIIQLNDAGAICDFEHNFFNEQ